MPNRPSPFGVTRTFLHFKMADVPRAWKVRMRELALPVADGGVFYRWTYHDGSTYCMILCEGKAKTENIVAWAGVSLQETSCPFVGVFVDEDRRGYGYAEDLVTGLLDYRADVLKEFQHIYAAAELYPKYKSILQERGYQHLEWE